MRGMFPKGFNVIKYKDEDGEMVSLNFRKPKFYFLGLSFLYIYSSKSSTNLSAYNCEKFVSAVKI